MAADYADFCELCGNVCPPLAKTKPVPGQLLGMYLCPACYYSWTCWWEDEDADHPQGVAASCAE